MMHAKYFGSFFFNCRLLPVLYLTLNHQELYNHDSIWNSWNFRFDIQAQPAAKADDRFFIDVFMQ